ncbi:hypothetical protein Hypma_008066 [Hypsizygus marmoreus]|uniref:Uncharacterized protein n=1 Tax=Hypsizygus marmoreus TaxID=39966 RepID=A0A369K3H7_HYPMA|nr:hypothetical protein Hypma_008066 [Hypsizygus marmoreus]
MSKSKASKPLALESILRDLALLRASELNVSTLLPSAPTNENSDNHADERGIDSSVEESYSFAQEARAALKIFNRNDVAVQGGRVEEARSKLDELILGLESKN